MLLYTARKKAYVYIFFMSKMCKKKTITKVMHFNANVYLFHNLYIKKSSDKILSFFIIIEIYFNF